MTCYDHSGFTASNPFDLYYMPYTHSLVAAIFWSCAGGLAYKLLARPPRWRASGIIGLAVFSHWVLDFIVHRPDLPLYDDSAKVGMGLWNVPTAAFGLEVAWLFGGIWWLYQQGRRAGLLRTLGFSVLMAAIQAYIFFGPRGASDRAMASTALLAYVVFATMIWWLQDRERSHEAA